MSLAVPTSLNKTQKRKVSPAAKFVLSSHYQGELKVPKWSDIGTLVQRRLREDVVQRLRDTDSGDVAEYLNVRHDELEKYIHQRVRSMREARNCNGVKGRGEKGSRETTLAAAKPQFTSAAHHLNGASQEFAARGLDFIADATALSESSSPSSSQWNKLPLRTMAKEQHQPKSSPQSRSQTWTVTQAWDNEFGYGEVESPGLNTYLDRFETNTTSYAANGQIYARGGVGIQAQNRQHNSLTTVAHRGIGTTSSSMGGTHHFKSESERSQKMHQDTAELEKLYEPPWNSKSSPTSIDSRKRKRITSNDGGQMKPPILPQTPLETKLPITGSASEGAVSNRFCYICEATHCPHTLKEQQSSAATSPLLPNSIKRETFATVNASAGSPTPIREQRRHTTEICSPRPQPLARTATEPRRSLQIETKSNYPPTFPSNRPAHRLSISSAVSAAGSEYSAGTSPRIRTSPMSRYDPLSDDEEARGVDVLPRTIGRHRRFSRGGGGLPEARALPLPQQSPRQMSSLLARVAEDDKARAVLATLDEHPARAFDEGVQEMSSRESTPHAVHAC